MSELRLIAKKKPKKVKKWSFWAKNRVYIVFGVKIESHGMLGKVRRAF